MSLIPLLIVYTQRQHERCGEHYELFEGEHYELFEGEHYELFEGEHHGII